MKEVDLDEEGLIQYLLELEQLAGLELTIGIMGELGQTAHENASPGAPGNGEASDSEASLAQIAYWNEFGTDDGHIPERSVFRDTYEELESGVERRLIGSVRKVGTGQADAKGQWDKIGLWYVGELRQEMIAYSDPGNAESTIEKKGEDNPWIDTGRIVNSIQYLVQPAGSTEADDESG